MTSLLLSGLNVAQEKGQLLENVFADPKGFGIAPDGRYRYELPGFSSALLPSPRAPVLAPQWSGVEGKSVGQDCLWPQSPLNDRAAQGATVLRAGDLRGIRLRLRGISATFHH